MALKDITLGQYFPGHSFVHKLDPRTKLLAVVLYIVALFLAKSFITYGIMFLLLAVSIAISKVPLKSIVRGLKPVVFIVVFTALIYKTRIRREDLTVVIFTMLGIALFFFDQLKPGYIFGNFVAIAAGMFMAGMYMAVGDLEGEARFSAIMIGQFLTFIFGLPAIIVTRPEFTATATLSIIILGVFQLGIAYILYVKSTKYCPPLACCLLGAVEPLLNPVWVLIFDGEKPGIFALIGGITVILSVTLWCVRGGQKTAAET